MKMDLRHKAVLLRQKGFSVQEISNKLAVAKSTAYVWVKNVALGFGARERLRLRGEKGRAKGVARNIQKRQELRTALFTQTRKTLSHIVISRETAKLLCALLYWCEGNKNASAVGFTNSDPFLMRTFMKLLRSAFALDESKFRICLHLHEYHNEQRQKKYWSRVLCIPVKQFSKVYCKPHTGKNTRPWYPGCVSLRYYDHRVAIELCAIWQLFGAKYGRVG